MADLSTTFAGLKLKNPIIIGSSGLSDSIENIAGLEQAGAAAIVLKSLFEEEILRDLNADMKRMNSEGFLYPETVDFYENMDAPNLATDLYIEQIRQAKKRISIPVIASINCISASQWTYFPGLIQQAGADALELNIFVLPSDLNRTAKENEEIYFDIISEVRKQVTIPLIVKLSYYFSNLAAFLKKISYSGIDGLVLFNRYYNPDIDIDSFEFTAGAVLSSPSDLYGSLRWVGILSGRLGCSLGASTGVHDGNSLIKILLTGADAAEVASTVYINGYEQIQIMLDELEHWMNGKNFQTIDDFKGMMSQSKTINPAAFERVQFMKYFRGFKSK
jgi:dihydroorotate dehydrogenase (fumarate)